jgi:cytochrome c oxidase subunit II
MVLPLVIILLVIGTVLFHVLSPWWFTPIASNWEMMDSTVKLTFWVTGTVFVIVNLFMAYAVIRYRHKAGSKALYRPEDNKLESWLTVATTIGVAALLTPGLFVWAKFVTVPSDAAVVEVLGQQWNWSYRFPGKDGLLGAADAKLISPENPFGIDPRDPKGQDDILVSSPELHIPLNKPVKILLRSRDVTHQFAVPQFRVKMDMVPGMVTYFWFTPTRTGSFNVLCEQLCGIAHFAMRGRVVVDEQPQFDAWLAGQPTFADVAAQRAGDPAAGAALYAVCSACHGPSGQGNQQLNAPRLAGQSSWYLVRQLHGFKQGWRGASPQDVYGQQMLPMAATLPDDAAVRNVVAYIGSLPEAPVPATVAGDAARGKALYGTCAYCHGNRGEGVWATKAPRLAGMSDWYLARQLRDFRSEIRGGHAQDFAGAQMLQMAQASGVVKDDRAIDDLAAYLATMR